MSIAYLVGKLDINHEIPQVGPIGNRKSAIGNPPAPSLAKDAAAP